MNYFLSDEYIHAKDEEHIKIALYLIDNLYIGNPYREALRKVALDISDYYTSYGSESAKISKETVVIEALRQQILSLHAHYPKTKENRSALLGLIAMLKTEVFTELERYNNE